MLHLYKQRNKRNTAAISRIVYLHGTPAQLHHFEQHHVFHAILLVVAIYPACSFGSFSFLPRCLLPLLSTLKQ